MNDQRPFQPVPRTERLGIGRLAEELEHTVDWLAQQSAASPSVEGQEWPNVATVDSRAAWVPVLGVQRTRVATPEQSSGQVWEIRPPHWEEAIIRIDSVATSRLGLITSTLLGVIGLGWIGVSNVYGLFDLDGLEMSSKMAISEVVERIIQAESADDPHARNARSSATGAAQFLDKTWLEMIHAYRRDLLDGRSEKALLDLRHDPKLSRDITTRFVERNAAILRSRRLPVTPGTLYLAHFAGPAGAVALLSGRENADAASLMASADGTGQMTRDKLIAANPFIKNYTVADLKLWADRKMRRPAF